MRILKKQISKDGEGMVKLLLEEPEDLYHAFHLICKGDYVRCSTVRKVVQESATGSVQSSRTRMNLTIEVEKIDYEPGSSELRVMGKNREENPFVKLGAMHTLDLEVTRDFTLRKARWDTVYLERLANATDLTKRAEVAAVVMDMGFALVCLVTDHMTVVRSKIEAHVPKKRGGDASAHDKGVEKFFAGVLESLLRNIDLEVVKCVVVASPGYVKDDFVKFVDSRLSTITGSSANAELNALRKKFLLVHSSSGHKGALSEVLAKPEVQLQMKDTKAAEEVQAMERFFEILNTDEHRAPYGASHVRKALDANAVETLLVCDELFRSAVNPAQRQRYVKMVEDARAANAKVFIFSKMHVSGEQLASLSGIAAILRYAMPHLDDIVSAEDADETIVPEDDIAEENDPGKLEDTLVAALLDFE
jgi:protein pelota